MTFTWDRRRWRRMSWHAMAVTPATWAWEAAAAALLALCVPAGAALRGWVIGEWALGTEAPEREAAFLAGLSLCLLASVCAATRGWAVANEHIGRIRDQAASVDGGWLTLTFRFLLRGLPGSRHIVQVRLDPAAARAEWDPRLGTLRIVSLSRGVWHGYTRDFARTGATSQYEPHPLAEFTFPDDFDPSLAQVVLSCLGGDDG